MRNEKPYGSLAAACDVFVRYVAAKYDDVGGGGSAADDVLIRRARRWQRSVRISCLDDGGGAVLVHSHLPAVLAARRPEARRVAAANRERFRVIYMHRYVHAVNCAS